MADAEVVIVAEDLGDLLGRADQRGGVAVGASELCDLGPQPLVDAAALVGEREQTPRAGGGMAVGRLAIAGLVLERGGARKNLSRLVPGLLLGRGDDRPHREAEVWRRTAVPDGRIVNARGDV